MQSKFLQEKAKNLLEASNILTRITEDCSNNESIQWEQIIQLIEVYHMTQQLDQSWVKEVFSAEELKQYVEFETELKSRTTPEEKATFENNWFDLIEEIKQNLHCDPKSAIGIHLGKKCMTFVNGLYGKEHAHLRTKKFENGFAKGKGLEENGLTPDIVSWLDQAIDAYWYERIYNVLDQADTIAASELLKQWNVVMDDMYGNDAERKAAILTTALQDDQVSPAAKNWLKKLAKS